MFGHDDQQGQQDPNSIPDQSIDNAMSGETEPVQAAMPAPAAQTVQPTSAPMAAASDDASVDDSTVDSPSPAASSPSSSSLATAGTSDANDLIDIKQMALTQLSPLVGHLDQTPEEKFRTTMMMIQASDNQSMIKDAFAAAQNIADEKTRAQALLDVVNEINYFTQQHEN
jgi:hypothetical protein